MKKLKFRGISTADGRKIYGVGAYIKTDAEYVIKGMIFLECQRGTVSQLIGVDKNDAEVYEGDRVIRIAPADDNSEKNWEMSATFEDYAAIRDGQIVKIWSAVNRE